MSFDQTWHNADPDAVGNLESGEPPDPGNYDVTLVDAGAFTSKKGEAWVSLKWQIIGSDHGWDVLLGFRSQSAANFTKREVRELGVPVDQIDSLSMLDVGLKEQVGRYFTVEVVQNGDYRNTYVRGAAAQGDVPDMAQAGAAAPAGGGDEVPF